MAKALVSEGPARPINVTTRSTPIRRWRQTGTRMTTTNDDLPRDFRPCSDDIWTRRWVPFITIAPFLPCGENTDTKRRLRPRLLSDETALRPPWVLFLSRGYWIQEHGGFLGSRYLLRASSGATHWVPSLKISELRQLLCRPRADPFSCPQAVLGAATYAMISK